jgi:hypothetical protein
MKRLETLNAVYDRLQDRIVVTIMGAVAAGDLTTIVAKVEAVGPSGYVTDLSLLENRFQFARSLRS